MKKLFENTNGNTFKLINENVDNSATLIREGLKKIFSNAGKSVTYAYIQNIGVGYIKDINKARKVALQEAMEISEEYGFVNDANTQQFVREDESEMDMSNPEEKREVQIGKEIINLTRPIITSTEFDSKAQPAITQIQALAKELIRMHGQS